MRVKPAPGCDCRHPHKPFPLLDRDGENVPDSPYWRKQLVTGAVVLCGPEPQAKAPKPAGKE